MVKYVRTTIEIDSEVRDRLKTFAKKSETYTQALTRMMDELEGK